MVRFTPYQDEDAAILASWLVADRWPFHVSSRPSETEVHRRIARGDFTGPANRTFWILDEQGDRVGLVVLEELDEATPVFDLRIREGHRGRGIGKQAVRWIAEHVFAHTDHHRVEAHTRADNIPMRRVLQSCGWVKEAYYRQAWPDGDGNHVDAVAYAMLEDDWRKGTVTPVPWDAEPSPGSLSTEER